MKRKWVSVMLAFAVLLGTVTMAAAEKETPEEQESVLTETITISNAEEFLSFAEKCSLDSWSLNKKVVLRADISLEGAAFDGIATFGGTFEGNGHTVRGFTVENNTAPAGLFRYLQSTAVVRNLNVSGAVAPGGEGTSIGGIVGVNNGTVEQCAFSGTVTGQTDVGGIAGRNFGILRDCRTEGKLTGQKRTGGIAGYNEGTVDGCENKMEVNVDSVDPVIDPTDIDLDFNLDLAQLSDWNTGDAPRDTGGVVGYSAGIILDCANFGPVGYSRIGYNLGGIVGRNCGFVDGCRNTGFIQGRKDVGGIAGQIEPNIATILSPDYLETLSKQFENLSGLTSLAGSHAAETGGDVRNCVERIAAYEESARSALDALMSGLIGDIGSGDFGNLPDTGALQELGNAIQGMANATKELQGIASDSVEDIQDDVDAISGQINSISRTFALATEDAKKETVTDISEANLGDISDGKLLNCTNSGTAESELNAGGIVGTMGMEADIDPEDDTPGGSATQRKRYELKAIVQECTNTGTVTSKRSYAGGICGRMELGLIYASRGYGVISSESGSYVGGIAGMTGGTVQQCFAKCTLSGKKYIGGIVGCGIAEDYSGESSAVRDCYAMVEISEARQFVGGISGDNIGIYTGNYFVSDSLKGINGVSYASLAEPISYEALLQTGGVPEAFRQLTLRFVIDGETVKEVPFDYGASFDASVYPGLPEKEGCYARWSVTDLTKLHFDTRVEAIYTPYVTALASEITRSDGRPVLFVQGEFREGDVLRAAPGTAEFSPDGEARLLEQWRLSIPEDGQDSHRIRYLPTEENVEMYLLEDGAWQKLSPDAMGSYLEFSAAGSEVEIAVTAVSAAGGILPYVPLAAGALLLLILILLLLKKKKKPHPAGKKDLPPETAPETDDKNRLE